MAYSVRPRFWQDPVLIALGMWLALSPWVLGLSSTGATLASALLGLALAATAAASAGGERRPLWRWAAFAAAVLVAGSPWLFGFGAERVAMLHMPAVGALAAVLAVWAQARDAVPDPVSGEPVSY
ncbi:SPW repeat protein [Ramlibacter sp. AW1]|uniref:SPW repeat protein n=1 Tax=Ramlibacter aurantiacus TaxID=2801330 RepID=A0A936ZQE7_9BURK|nr:SPW repeat protein [Ramlibacter aurantiacus]MBL0418799.1 SPW repeat protein [Ramlibacter aurantiacus]